MSAANENTLNESEVNELLAPILEKEKIKAKDVKISDGSVKGTGYMSFLVRVDVAGEPKDLHLMIKCIPRQKTYRTKFSEESFYREMKFYDAVAPTLADFQAKRGVADPFRALAKCHKTSDVYGKELLILENITERGFVMWDRTRLMDEAHVAAVMREYGRYHATSHALRDQRPDEFEKITDGVIDFFSISHIPEDVLNMFFVVTDKLITLYDAEKEKASHEVAKRIRANVVDYMKYLESSGVDRRHPTLVHGDCWCSNILFKYEGSKDKPSELCIIDFQGIAPKSGMADLAYFLYASCTIEMLDNVDKYLDVYYDSLAGHLKALGSDPEKVYPKTAMKEEWKAYRRFGVIIGMTIVLSLYRNVDEVVNAKEAATEAEMMEAFTKESGDPRINERRKQLLEHFVRQGFENDY